MVGIRKQCETIIKELESREEYFINSRPCSSKTFFKGDSKILSMYFMVYNTIKIENNFYGYYDNVSKKLVYVEEKKENSHEVEQIIRMVRTLLKDHYSDNPINSHVCIPPNVELIEDTKRVVNLRTSKGIYTLVYYTPYGFICKIKDKRAIFEGKKSSVLPRNCHYRTRLNIIEYLVKSDDELNLVKTRDVLFCKLLGDNRIDEINFFHSIPKVNFDKKTEYEDVFDNEIKVNISSCKKINFKTLDFIKPTKVKVNFYAHGWEKMPKVLSNRKINELLTWGKKHQITKFDISETKIKHL